MSVSAAAQLPIVKIAAGAVIVLSAVGVGVMTGMIPGVASNDRTAIEAQAPAETAQVAPVEQAPPKPIVKERVAPAPIRASEERRSHLRRLRRGRVGEYRRDERRGDGRGRDRRRRRRFDRRQSSR